MRYSLACVRRYVNLTVLFDICVSEWLSANDDDEVGLTQAAVAGLTEAVDTQVNYE